MRKYDFRRRATAVVILLISLSTILLYLSVEAAGRQIRPVAPPSVQSNQSISSPSSRGGAIAAVTAALEKNDFGRARSASDNLVGLSMHDQIGALINSAEMRWRMQQIGFALNGANYDEARKWVQAIDGAGARRELIDMIDFAEARTALRGGNMETASKLGSSLRPGLKRAILMIALSAHTVGEHDTALRYARLAAQDLPYIDRRYRRRVLTMIAGATLRVDLEYGLATLDKALHAEERIEKHEHEVTGEAPIILAGDGFVQIVSVGALASHSL